MNAVIVEEYVQLAFFGDATRVTISRKVSKPNATIARLERMVLTLERQVIDIGVDMETHPCTWPGCHRGRQDPFPTGKALASHRFTAHGIRSANEDSIRRQERRDRQRALVKVMPEYIDAQKIREAVAALLPINLSRAIKAGEPDAGEREAIRRRLCWLLTTLPKEVHRTPGEIAVAAAQALADGLRPPSVIGGEDQRVIDVRMERMAQLFQPGTLAAMREEAERSAIG